MNKKRFNEIKLDYQEGLNRFAGKSDLYDKFLLKFLDDNNFSQAEILIAKEKFEEAYIFIHTLKGLAGNLSMHGLYECCTRYTDAKKENKLDDLGLYFTAIAAEYAKVIEVLKE